MQGFLDGFRRLRAKSVFFSGQTLFLLALIAAMLAAVHEMPRHVYVHDWNNAELNAR
jgi:hypothetical protein